MASKNKALAKFIKQHYREDIKGYRLGQRFCNQFIKEPYPELFYANDTKAKTMISAWLHTYQYYDDLPPEKKVD